MTLRSSGSSLASTDSIAGLLWIGGSSRFNPVKLELSAADRIASQAWVPVLRTNFIYLLVPKTCPKGAEIVFYPSHSRFEPLRVVWAHGQPPGAGDQSLPAPAPREPGRLVPLGRGGPRAGPRRGPPGLALGRLLGLPLVPRDGARVLRGSRGRRLPERALR